MFTYPQGAFYSARSFLMQTEIDAEAPSVTARDGVVYPRMDFESYQHERMVLLLCDREKADRFWKSYNGCLLSHLWGSSEARKAFEKWLFENIHLLGCEPKRNLEEVLRLDVLAPFSNEVAQFFDQVACKEHTHEHDKKIKLISKRVFIITPSGGGGELAVTKAMERHLSQFDYQVKILDVEDFLGDDEDVLYRFSKGIYSGDIWGTFYQGENNPELAEQFWAKCAQLKSYIPNQSSSRMKAAIREFAPDVILSMRYSMPEDVSFGCDLNIPVRFVHCDYRFAPQLSSLVKRVNPQMVKFWVPAKECILEGFQDRIELLGYPIRSGIVKEVDPHKLTGIKDRFGIKSLQKVVVVMMGRQGFSKGVTGLVEQIVAAEGQLGPLHVAVICGNNKEMKGEIERQLTGSIREISFHVYGYVDEQFVSDYLNVADLFIGKAGGATTSELIHMNVSALVPESYELEVANFNYMASLGLATRLVESRLIDQMKEMLSKKREEPLIKTTSWQENLLALLSSI